MRLIDKEYALHPYCGSGRMTARLNRDKGEEVNRKRVRRLMRLMGPEAVCPRPKLSAGRNHEVYPYLLRGVTVAGPDQARSADITCVGLPGGFAYLTSATDWFSRFVPSRGSSGTPGGSFRIEAPEAAPAGGRPEVFGTDQGTQFTAEAFAGRLESAG